MKAEEHLDKYDWVASVYVRGHAPGYMGDLYGQRKEYVLESEKMELEECFNDEEEEV